MWTVLLTATLLFSPQSSDAIIPVPKLDPVKTEDAAAIKGLQRYWVQLRKSKGREYALIREAADIKVFDTICLRHKVKIDHERMDSRVEETLYSILAGKLADDSSAFTAFSGARKMEVLRMGAHTVYALEYGYALLRFESRVDARDDRAVRPFCVAVEAEYRQRSIAIHRSLELKN